VKTVSLDEANTLLEILEKYELHLKENANSLLVRFLGLHSLKMYNRIFSFVVMRNIFPPLATINQRYDIKGSWVNRNSAPVPPGVRVLCRHCGDLFVSGSQTSCPDLVGEHEANFVLKDNDFTSKIRLRPDDAYNLIDVLNKDSDALCSMGITDYSLLIGIRNLQYEVEPGRIISQGRKSTLHSFSDTSTSFDIKRSDDFSILESGKPAVTPPPLPLRSLSLSSNDSHQQRLLTKNTSKNSSTTKKKMKDVKIAENHNEKNSQMMDLMEEELTGGYLARSVIAPGVYYMGAVDILQKWTIRKRVERLYKIYVLGRSGAGISCMAPEPYKVRFQQKVSQIIEHSIFIREITGSWKGKRELTEPTTLINT
jgi:1-phosphatidylinositol-4-phosphate 5-kinase